MLALVDIESGTQLFHCGLALLKLDLQHMMRRTLQMSIKLATCSATNSSSSWTVSATLCSSVSI
jgi:hypothetical protein